MSKTKERIRDSQLRYKQGLGQNFIYDEALLEELVRLSGVGQEDDVLPFENPLYERSNIRIEDIDLKDLVILSPGNCMRDQIIELCQARRSMPTHYSFESGSLDTLMRIVDCTSCLTIVPEMSVEFIPSDRRDRLKTLAKGAMSRKIAVAVRGCTPDVCKEFDHQGADGHDSLVCGAVALVIPAAGCARCPEERKLPDTANVSGSFL